MKENKSSINHGVINLKKNNYTPKPEFKRRDMMMWYIETRLDELNNISLGATQQELLLAQMEYKRLKSGVYYLLSKQYEEIFENSNHFFQFIQAGISKDLNILKETLINHINNNHMPQLIDLNRFDYLNKVQTDWQKYMNLIIHVVE